MRSSANQIFVYCVTVNKDNLQIDHSCHRRKYDLQREGT